MPKKLLSNDRQYCLEVIELKQRTECDFIILGRELDRIKREEKWRAGWSSWEEYLVDMRLAPSSAYQIISIWKKLVEMGGIEPLRIAKAGGWTVVAKILPKVKEKDDAEKYISLVEAHPTRTALAQTLEEEERGSDMAKCRHEDVYYLRICRDCGLREQVFVDGQKVADCG